MRIPSYPAEAPKVVLGVCLLAAVMASAIAWRIDGRPGVPTLWTILPWQMAVWAPWAGYFYIVRWLSRRLQSLPYPAPAIAGLHALAALLVAFTHLVWFWQISSLVSPLQGLPNTRFGVYAFFFVFWFLIDLLLYPAVLAAPRRERREESRRAEADAPAEEPAGPAAYARTFAVRKGRARHVVRTEDICWIEAQGYYAALHTPSGSYLVRRSLARLELELDPEQFIRIHRSTIVRIDNISDIQSETGGAASVSLVHGGRRRVSRAGYQALKSRFRSLA